MTKTYKTTPDHYREKNGGKIIHKTSENIVAGLKKLLIIVIIYDWNFLNICSDTGGYA